MTVEKLIKSCNTAQLADFLVRLLGHHRDRTIKDLQDKGLLGDVEVMTTPLLTKFEVMKLLQSDAKSVGREDGE